METETPRTDKASSLEGSMDTKFLIMCEVSEKLEMEVARWKMETMPFLAIYAVEYGEKHIGKGSLFADHYDLLEEAGARMVDFHRGPKMNPES
jgi:hypothetical protein